jgi:hypothetical protein
MLPRGAERTLGSPGTTTTYSYNTANELTTVNGAGRVRLRRQPSWAGRPRRSYRRGISDPPLLACSAITRLRSLSGEIAALERQIASVLEEAAPANLLSICAGGSGGRGGEQVGHLHCEAKATRRGRHSAGRVWQAVLGRPGQSEQPGNRFLNLWV